MAEHRLIKVAANIALWLILSAVVALLTACSAEKKATRSPEHLVKENIPRSPSWNMDAKAPPDDPPPPPPFASLTEDIVPLKTKIVNIVVRNSTLGDVLHVMAEASGLNLLIDRDVYLDQLVTISLRNTLAEDALKTIFSNLDCFYTIENNVLKVESMGTRIFELGHPALANTYSMNIGGNISGSGMSGAITSSSTADVKAQDFWGSLEKTLENILGKQEPQSAPTPKTAEVKAPSPNQPAKPGTSTGAIGEDSAVTATFSNTASFRFSSGKQKQNITINRLTGTIMVTASRKSMEQVERYIETVKKVLNRGVMIEARIIEVQLNEGIQYGIDWTVLAKTALGVGPAGAGFGTLNMASTATDAATLASSGSSKFQLGVSRANFQAILTALQTQGDLRMLSNPKINVMNGHASILTVGTNTSFISKVTTTTTAGVGTNAANSISFVPETSSVLSGMIIGIVPYISEKGDITLNITPITSDLTKLEDKTFGSGGNQITITIPTVALREMTTTVKMRDGQMVIIGGLISSKESSSDEKIPLLGSIPYLGKLFTRTNNTETRSELVILLRPTIVDNE
jgi:MSHA type pilus biogenesis protein MshL